MTEQPLLDEWVKRLELQEWRITLNTNCKPDDMEPKGAAGCAKCTDSLKTARIDILDPKYYGDRIDQYDFENALVQGLLRLKMRHVIDLVPELQAWYMHQMIDDLARALVDAKDYGLEEW